MEQASTVPRSSFSQTRTESSQTFRVFPWCIASTRDAAEENPNCHARLMAGKLPGCAISRPTKSNGVSNCCYPNYDKVSNVVAFSFACYDSATAGRKRSAITSIMEVGQFTQTCQRRRNRLPVSIRDVHQIWSLRYRFCKSKGARYDIFYLTLFHPCYSSNEFRENIS